jgi:hypothetical protein
MTHEEYKKFLRDLEQDIFNRCPIIGITNAKSIVNKADIEKHCYSEYEVEQYAYELADFVEDCIKEYRRQNASHLD